MLRWLPESRAALPQRPGQLRFHRLQFRNLGPDNAEFLRDQIPDVDANLMRMTLDRKQLADFVEGKPELLRLLDKFEIGNFPLLIKPIAALRPRRARQQPRLFIEADGIDTQAGFLRDLTDLQEKQYPSPQAYSLECTPESSTYLKAGAMRHRWSRSTEPGGRFPNHRSAVARANFRSGR